MSNYYYIISNQIIGYQEEIDTNIFGGQLLTEEQKTFYIQHPYASIEEVLQLSLNQPEQPEQSQFEILKIQKLQQLESWYQNQKEQGYLDTTGYRLFMHDSDINNYTQLKVFIMGLPNTQTIQLGTMSGWITVTVEECNGILNRYGNYVYQLYYNYSNKKQAIYYSTTVEELNNVII